MKIITCIKQVPASSDVKVDPVTGVLIRDSQQVKMNPYDLYGLELSFKLKDEHENINVHAVSMGPPSAKQVLHEAIYMGADEASLITDRLFAGADVLATSYTLSQLIKTIDHYDLIICGKQTTDGDTAQVGPEMAEFLNIPHIPYVKEILNMDEKSITVLSDYEDFEEVVTIKLPCLITVEKSKLLNPRLPSYNRKRLYEHQKINELTLKQLKDQNEKHYGLKGSPTQVEEIFPPQNEKHLEILKGSANDVANKIVQVLNEHKYI